MNDRKGHPDLPYLSDRLEAHLLESILTMISHQYPRYSCTKMLSRLMGLRRGVQVGTRELQDIVTQSRAVEESILPNSEPRDCQLM
jgi:hypothetical protein